MSRVLVGVAVAAVLVLTGCSAGTPDVEAAPEASASGSDTIAPPAIDTARAAAISMDPTFADDAVWAASQDTAQKICNMADADPAGAWNASVGFAYEYGVTGEQLGILWGIAVNVYCPEHAGVVPQ